MTNKSAGCIFYGIEKELQDKLMHHDWRISRRAHEDRLESLYFLQLDTLSFQVYMQFLEFVMHGMVFPNPQLIADRIFCDVLDVEMLAIPFLVDLELLWQGIDTSVTNAEIARRQGYVYVVQSPTGYYKIGRTRNPRNRLRTFEVKLPFEVEYSLVLLENNAISAEKMWHEFFEDCRVGGEWFALESYQLRMMCELYETHDVTDWWTKEAEEEARCNPIDLSDWEIEFPISGKRDKS